MKYDFASRNRDFGRIVFALTLDRKKLTERIIIARSNEARLRLEKDAGDVYYDEVRPLGSLLIGFESDKTGEWNKNAFILRDSYGKSIPRMASRWKHAAPANHYLRGKAETDEPSALFAAARTWDEYLNCFNLNHGADLLIERLAMLYKPFSVYADYRPWQENAAETLSRATLDGESAVELWYLGRIGERHAKRAASPVGKRVLECVVASVSLTPVIAYYLHKVEEWRYVFQQCKVCGKDFLARSRHYELCSDDCRKKQAMESKREFDERAKDDRLEQLDEAAYQYWYNRLRKLKKGKNANPEKAAVVGATLKAFRKEAVKRKGEVKRGVIKFAEFTGWLVKQQDVVDALMAAPLGACPRD
jgi:hypothetical protein